MNGASAMRALGWLEARKHALSFLGLLLVVVVISGMIEVGRSEQHGFLYLALMAAAGLLGAQGVAGEKVDGALPFRRALPLDFRSGLWVQLAASVAGLLGLLLLAAVTLGFRGESIPLQVWLLVGAGGLSFLFLASAASLLLPDGLSAVPAGALGLGLWSTLLVAPHWVCWGNSAAFLALVPGGLPLLVGLPAWLAIRLPVWLDWTPAARRSRRRRVTVTGLLVAAVLAWGLTLRPSLAVRSVRAGSGTVLSAGVSAGPRAGVAYRVVDRLGHEHGLVAYTDVGPNIERKLLPDGSATLGWFRSGELLLQVGPAFLVWHSDGRTDPTTVDAMEELIPQTAGTHRVNRGQLEQGTTWIHGGTP